jgi:DNA-binding MarR family transcriptional regulator
MDPLPCYCVNSRRAAQALTARYDEALAPHGLKVTQYSLLCTVARHGAPNLTRLAGATGLDRSTLGRNLRGLEALGLVTLSAGEDLRDRVATLTPHGAARLREAGVAWVTPAGKDRIRAAAPAWKQAQAEVEAALGSEVERLTALLRKVTALAGRQAGAEVVA